MGRLYNTLQHRTQHQLRDYLEISNIFYFLQINYYYLIKNKVATDSKLQFWFQNKSENENQFKTVSLQS